MIALLAAASSSGDDNEFLLWLGIAGVTVLIGFLAWWLVGRPPLQAEETEREHRRDPDWGSQPSDATQL